MDFIEVRDAAEFFLLRLQDAYPEDKDMALCVLCSCIGTVDESIITDISEGRVPKCDPDFIDDSGRKRLRIRTISHLTGIDAESLVHLKEKGLDPRFVDAVDFISLNKNNFINGNIQDEKDFIEAHSVIVDYGPDEVARAFEEKFKESFGEIPYNYTDEHGEKYISTEALAKFFSIPADEVNKKLEDAVRRGQVKRIELPPDPENGTLH